MIDVTCVHCKASLSFPSEAAGQSARCRFCRRAVQVPAGAVATAGTGRTGTDLEGRIVDRVIEQFQRETGIDLRSDPMAVTRITESAAAAAHELASSSGARIHLPFITVDTSGPKHLDVALNRSHFE